MSLDASVRRESAVRSDGALYRRDLPGGGFVAIRLADPASERSSVSVVVERRSDLGRRAGHQPPVILKEEWKPDRGFGALYLLACDNVAIARGLLRLRRAD